MKTIIIVFFLVFSVVTYSQEFRERVNLLIGGGYELQKDNTNIHNQFGWIYVDYHIIKGKNWMFGPYVIAGLSGSSNNVTRYNGNGQELGFGGTIGYWDELSSYYNSYSSFNLGIKYNTDLGESRLPNGTYRGEQSDILLNTSVSFDGIKKNDYSFFNRTKVSVTYQIPLNAYKSATWNNVPIKGDIWQSEYGKIEVKQGIVGIPLGSIVLSPKAVVQYKRARGRAFMAWARESLFTGKGEIAFSRLLGHIFMTRNIEKVSSHGK